METDLPNPWYNNQTYVNTLDPEAIRRFLEVTHERYLQAVGKDFGGLVPAIFTDEPQFSRKSCLGFAADAKDVILPWSDDVPDTFRQAWGEDLLAHLPELIWELPDGQVSLIRYHYHDHIAERFASAFADQCGEWCAKHGLMLTGHMNEEPTLLSQTSVLGEAMRSYRSFQLPGIDMLCGWWEFTTAKQAQSAVHQYGRPGMLSELYGVTGWAFDFRGHKLHGDWQAALGVTVRVPHLSWVSMKGEAKRDYPASINYQSPWWSSYSLVEDHFARVNAAMTRGKPLVRVGVIHPIESYWLHWGPEEQTHGIRQQLEDQFQNITRWLLLGGIDFDFICESLLPSQCAQGGAPLQVGEMAYDAILVPGCETLRATTLERLEAFQAAGGRLIFLGNAPQLEDARPSGRGQALYQAALQVPSPGRRCWKPCVRCAWWSFAIRTAPVRKTCCISSAGMGTGCGFSLPMADCPITPMYPSARKSPSLCRELIPCAFMIRRPAISCPRTSLIREAKPRCVPRFTITTACCSASTIPRRSRRPKRLRNLTGRPWLSRNWCPIPSASPTRCCWTWRSLPWTRSLIARRRSYCGRIMSYGKPSAGPAVKAP